MSNYSYIDTVESEEDRRRREEARRRELERIRQEQERREIEEWTLTRVGTAMNDEELLKDELSKAGFGVSLGGTLRDGRKENIQRIDVMASKASGKPVGFVKEGNSFTAVSHNRRLAEDAVYPLVQQYNLNKATQLLKSKGWSVLQPVKEGDTIKVVARLW